MRKPEEARSAPYMDYPNPQSANLAGGVGAFEKGLASLGIGEDRERRTSIPWGAALRNTVANFSPSNLLHSIGEASEAAKRYEPFTGNKSVGETAATLMNTPVLGAPLAAAVKGPHVGMPVGRGLHPELPFPEPEPVGTSPLIGHNLPPAPEPEIKPGKQPTERYLNPLGMYSAAKEGAANLPIGKKGWTREQILARLPKEPNVKPEEIQWMDLSNKLKEKKVWTKDELNQLIEQQEVKPQKKVLEGEGSMSEEEAHDQAREGFWEDAAQNLSVEPDHEAVREREGQLTVEHDPNEDLPLGVRQRGRWLVIDDDLRNDDPDAAAEGYHILGRYETEREANAALKEHARQWVDELGIHSVYDEDDNRITAYDGRNPTYTERDRERLLDQARENYVDRQMENFDWHEYARDYGEEGPLHKGQVQDRPGGEEGGEDYREAIYTIPREISRRLGQEQFTSSHYESAKPPHTSVVNHALLADYVDAATGKPVTYMVEGQSDWQKAQQKYGVAQPVERVAALNNAYREARNAFVQLDQGFFAENPLTPLKAERLSAEQEIAGTKYYRINPQDKQSLESLANTVGGDWGRVRRADRLLDERLKEARTGVTTDRNGRIARSELTPEEMNVELQRLQQIKDDFLKEFNDDNARYQELLSKYQPMSPEEAKAYRDQLNAADLRQQEAYNAHRQASQGVPQGPFVGDKSAANDFLAKQLLIEAANDARTADQPMAGWEGSGSSYVSWPSPELITSRWSRGLQENYEKLLPGAMLKWAQRHDPNAKLTTVHIGNYQGPGPAKSAPYFNYHPDERVPPEQLPLEGGKAKAPEEVLASVKPALRENMERKFAEPTLTGLDEIAMREKPADIQMGVYRPYERNYSPRRTQIEPISEYAGPTELKKPDVMPGFVLVDEKGDPVHGGAFRTREHAERALQAALKFYEENPRMTMEELAKKFDLMEQPAIEMTPAMRESIRKKGFPLFVAGAPVAPGVMLDKHYGEERADGGGIGADINASERASTHPMPRIAYLEDRPSEFTEAGELPPAGPGMPFLRPFNPGEVELAGKTDYDLAHEHEHSFTKQSPTLSHVPQESMQMVNALPGEAARHTAAKIAMTAGLMLGKLTKEGWRIVRNASGHVELTHPTMPGRIQLPESPSAPLHPKSLSNILDIAGFTPMGNPRVPMEGQPENWLAMRRNPGLGMYDPMTGVARHGSPNIQETKEVPDMPGAVQEMNEKVKGLAEVSEPPEHHWDGGLAGYQEGGMPGMPHPYNTSVFLREPGTDPSELQYVTPSAPREQSLTNPTLTSNIPQETTWQEMANAIVPGGGAAGRAGMAKGLTKFRHIMDDLKGAGWRHVGTEGSHAIFTHPTKPGRIPVQCNHPNQTCKPGTMRDIYESAGLPVPSHVTKSKARLAADAAAAEAKNAPPAVEAEPTPEYGPIDPGHVSLGNNKFYDPNNDIVIHRTGPEAHAYTAQPLDRAAPEDQEAAFRYLEEHTKRRGGRIGLTAFAA